MLFEPGPGVFAENLDPVIVGSFSVVGITLYSRSLLKRDPFRVPLSSVSSHLEDFIRLVEFLVLSLMSLSARSPVRVIVISLKPSLDVLLLLA